MHRAAYHFIQALRIPSLTKTKAVVRAIDNDDDIEAENDDNIEAEGDMPGEAQDEADIDISTEIDASADDVEAMAATTVVDYDPGDTVGKVLAFVNQVRMSSEGVREYLAHACTFQGIKPMELRLWVRTRWGSLSDCLESVLEVHNVCRSTFANNLVLIL